MGVAGMKAAGGGVQWQRRVAAHFITGKQRRIAVERGIFDAFRHRRSAELLEALREPKAESPVFARVQRIVGRQKRGGHGIERNLAIRTLTRPRALPSAASSRRQSSPAGIGDRSST